MRRDDLRARWATLAVTAQATRLTVRTRGRRHLTLTGHALLLAAFALGLLVAFLVASHATGDPRAGAGTLISAAILLRNPSARTVHALLGQFPAHFYGAAADGVTDDSAAIQAACDAAISAYPSTAVTGAQTNRTGKVILKAADYLIAAPVLIDLVVDSTATSDRRRIHIQGQGTDQTALICDSGFTGKAIQARRGALSMSDLTMHGRQAFTGDMLTLGDQGLGVQGASGGYVNHFHLDRVEFRGLGPNGRALVLNWCFDGTIINCGCHQNQPGAIGVDFEFNPGDNVNNLTFIRWHGEGHRSGAMVRARYDPTSSRGRHISIVWINAHLETRSYGVTAFDLEGITRWSFIGGYFVQNNTFGADLGYTRANAVPLFRLINTHQVHFHGGGLSRSTGTLADDWGSKPIALGGNARGVTWEGFHFNTGELTAPNLARLWQSDATTPYTAGGIGPQIVGSTTSASTHRERGTSKVLIESAKATGNLFWGLSVDTTDDYLDIRQGDSRVTATGSGKSRIYPDGGISATRGYYAGQQAVVASEGTNVWVLGFTTGVNPNRVAAYLIYAKHTVGATASNANAVALIFTNGNSLHALGNTGSGVVLADPATPTVNPDVSGKLNIYLDQATGGRIAVKNRMGADRSVAVVPFAFTTDPGTLVVVDPDPTPDPNPDPQ